jgi:cephalosporin-C deacetylase-like acetyl esterase
MRRAVFAAVVASIACLAQTDDARQALIRDLNVTGTRQVKARAVEVARINTKAAAEQRKRDVRSKLANLIGGIPEPGKQVAVRQFGSVQGDGFRIEKIAYESLPGLWVTANVYVPLAGAGPFPAVLLTPGHEPTGKLGQYNWGANLANNGVIGLAVDPVGQGERLQHFDPELGESKVGQGTGEHGHAGFATMLLGDHVAQYFITDAMRGIDYLANRKDVDAARIGAFGCSGGGTATAYLAAFDPRLKAVAVACYITSFEALLPTAGPQEAEQSIPHFLEQGLDFGDWVELAAPKPYAIISTESDMFPFAGAKQTYEEAKRIYSLYGAGDRLEWITGPGGHGALQPIAPKILAFLTRALKDDPKPPAFRQFPPLRREDLLCTPTGQLSTSIGGETVESINRKRLQPHKAQPAKTADIRSILQIGPDPGKTLYSVTTVKTEPRDGFRVETIQVAGAPGLAAIPESAGRHAAVVLLDSAAKEATAARPDFERLAKSGHLVVVLQPRGTPGPNTPVQSPLLGPFNLIALRAMVVGQTIVGMRVEDTLRVIEWLARRPDVDPAAITVYGNGPLGVVALHAAALDSRIAAVVIENTLISYRTAVEQPLHRNLAEIALPGVLRAYDLGDLMLAVGSRQVTVVNPVDAVGQPVREDVYRKEMADVLAARPVHLLSRGLRDPLPVE